MSGGSIRFVLGCLLGLGSISAVVAGASALRRRYLPNWVGPHGMLVTSIIAVTVVMGVAWALGVVRSFRLVPLAAALIAVGLGTVVADRRLGPRPQRRDVSMIGVDGPPGEAGRGLGVVSRWFAIVAVVVVVAEWGYRTWWALQRGIHTVDSLWYHLPFAARWAQTGDLTQIHYTENGPLTAFFPSNGSIPHAIGMMFLETDLASVFLNLGWLALALLAGWCLGQPFGVGHLSLGATAVICTTPSLMATQAGGAYSDIVGIALLLAALAVVVTAVAREPDRFRPPYAVAAAAAGIAFGSKYQFIIPVMALSVGVVALGPRAARLRRSIVWMAVLVVTGSFWYLRSWVRVGNPVPQIGLQIGPLRFEETPGGPQEKSFLSIMFDAEAWREWFLPGLDAGIGDLWWLLLAGLTVLLVIGLFRDRSTRLVCGVALVTLGGFFVSPALYGPAGSYHYFTVIMRYLAPGLAMGAAGASLAVAGRRWGQWVLIGIMGAYLTAVQIRSSTWGEPLETLIDQPIWGRETMLAILLTAGVLGVAAVLITRVRSLRPRSQTAVVILLVLGLTVAAVPVRRHYLIHRYKDPMGVLKYTDVSWVRGVRDQRIGMTSFNFQYPFFGSDMSNDVRRIGEPGPHGSWRTIRSCADLVEHVNTNGYSLVVFAGGGLGGFDAQGEEWLRSAGAVPRSMRLGTVVLRVGGDLDPRACEDGDR